MYEENEMLWIKVNFGIPKIGSKFFRGLCTRWTFTYNFFPSANYTIVWGKILNELSLICVDEMNRRHGTQHNDIQLKDIQLNDK